MRTAKARSKARTPTSPAQNRSNSAAKRPVSASGATATIAPPDAAANAAAAPSAAVSPPDRAAPPRTHSALRALGLIGLESIEPVILAAIATETPLLLMGIQTRAIGHQNLSTQGKQK
jgi:hypothetical protein